MQNWSHLRNEHTFLPRDTSLAPSCHPFFTCPLRRFQGNNEEQRRNKATRESNERGNTSTGKQAFVSRGAAEAGTMHCHPALLNTIMRLTPTSLRLEMEGGWRCPERGDVEGNTPRQGIPPPAISFEVICC